MDEKKAELEMVEVDEIPAKVKVKEKPKRKLVNVFRFATCLDVMMIFLGLLCSIIHGAALPMLFFVFGDLIDNFSFYSISASVINLVDNYTDVSCDSTFNATIGNIFFSDATITSVVREAFNYTNFECTSEASFEAGINMLVYIIVGLAVAVFVIAFTQVSTLQWAAERQVHTIRLRYYRSVIRQNIAWFDENPAGELANRLSDDINKIYAGIGDKLGLFVQWMATFVAGFTVAFYSDYRLTLFLLAFTPLIIISGSILSKITIAFTNRELKEYGAAGAVAEEVISSIRTVMAFGGEERESERYIEKLNEARRLGIKKGFSVGTAIGFVIFFLFFLYSLAFWFGAYLIQDHNASSGQIITAFFTVIVGAFSFGKAFPFVEDLLTAMGAAVTIFETIDRTPVIDSSSEEGIKPDHLKPSIILKNVEFSYPSRSDVNVLKNVSLSVKEGQTVALVGPSGCGKSTIIQLVQRFYDVTAGEVSVGGVNVKELNVKWLRRHVGVVSQEPVLFDTTIAENIRLGRESATSEEIQEAAKKANAHDFITSLPHGYNTHVGEGGTQMSGGQKQRIAIARALVRDPKILLLDEATSALDTRSEKVVQEALDKAREGRTTIVIAHRLSTIQNADVIIVVDKGSVVETGTHSELVQQQGLYHNLVRDQSFGTDELYIQSKSLNRLLSQQSITKDNEIKQQVSIQNQKSVEAKDFKKELEKKQEVWDKDLQEVPLKRIIVLNAKEWWMILLGVIGAAIGGSILPLFAIFFGEILDAFAQPPDQVLGAVHLWAGLFFALAVISGVGALVRTVCFTVAGENLTKRLRSRVFRAFLRQEVGWYDQERNSTGALTTRLAHDAAQVQGAVGSRIGVLVETCFGLLLAITIALAFSWLLTLVILGLVPFLLFSGSLQLKVFTNHSTKLKKNLETAGKLAVDSIENIRTVASLNIESSFIAKYSEEVNVIYKASAVLQPLVYGLTYGFTQAFVFLMYAVVFRFGAFLVVQDSSSILHVEFQNIFRVFMAITFGALSAGQASSFAPDYAKAKVSAKRIFAILDRVPTIDNSSEEGEKLDDMTGAVSIDSVTFSYPTRSEVQVLKGLSVDLKPGQTLALVGPSGCGKSTVVSLLERFYDPVGGSIKVDGVDSRDAQLKWLRSQLGLVSQEPVLFDTTIADNIRYGALFRDVSEDEIISAAKQANIHSFIETLPMGYNTNVGAKGTQLSGGQKQRIAIARALVRDPKILLLDEATSALDTESEKVVQEALDKAREGRTTIVIAHRLSTIYNSDIIAVIEDGKVFEMGTHSELLANKGLYYKLNNFQVVDKTSDL